MSANSSRSTLSLIEAVRRTETAHHELSLVAAVDVFCAQDRPSPAERAGFVALLQPLFQRASPQVKHQIAAKLRGRDDLPQAVHDILASLDAVSPAEMATLTATALSFLDAVDAQRELLLERIVSTPKSGGADLGVTPQDAIAIEQVAGARQMPPFMKRLGEALGLSPAAIRRIVMDEGGEPLLVALIAVGLSHDSIVRVMLLNNERAGRSVERLYKLVRVAKSIDRDSASLMVMAWRRSGIAEAIPQQTVTSPSQEPATPPQARVQGISAGPGLVLRPVKQG